VIPGHAEPDLFARWRIWRLTHDQRLPSGKGVHHRIGGDQAAARGEKGGQCGAPEPYGSGWRQELHG
jgi:hypothetical protein